MIFFLGCFFLVHLSAITVLSLPRGARHHSRHHNGAGGGWAAAAEDAYPHVCGADVGCPGRLKDG